MLAIVAEVRSPKYANTEDMFQRILESVARDHHVNVHAIVLIPPRTITKTSSGKIRRFKVRQMLYEESLPSIKNGVWRISLLPGRSPLHLLSRNA